MSDGLDNAQRRASLRSSAHIDMLYENIVCKCIQNSRI